MFEQLTVYLIVLALAVAIHYIIPRSRSVWRQLSISAWSTIFLSFISPLVVIAAIAASILLWLHARYLTWGANAKRWSWLLTAIAVLAFALQRLFSDLGAADTIGFSYLVIKYIGATWTLKKNEKLRLNSSVLDSFTLLIFFPIFSAGPIEKLATFNRERFSNAIEFDNFVVGLYRILFGIFKTVFICGTILSVILNDLRPEIFSSTSVAWVYVYLNFLLIYFSFSGYTDIAVGSGRLLGLRIAENFRFPLISSSVQEFWQRWHLSLSSFLTEFLFRPLLFQFRGRAAPAIICAFVIVGLWHKFSIGYLIWGFGHGFMMIISRDVGRHIQQTSFFSSRIVIVVKKLIGILFTLSYVACLSSIANIGDSGQIALLIKTLFGF